MSLDLGMCMYFGVFTFCKYDNINVLAKGEKNLILVKKNNSTLDQSVMVK